MAKCRASFSDNARQAVWGQSISVKRRLFVVNFKGRCASMPLRMLVLAGGIGAMVSVAAAAPPANELASWSKHFMRALQTRAASPGSQDAVFTEPSLNAPGSLPIAQRLILYRTLVTGETMDFSEGTINSAVIGVGPGDMTEITPVTPVCGGPVEAISGGEESISIFTSLIGSGSLITNSDNAVVLERHIAAAFGGESPGVRYEVAGRSKVEGNGLVSQDMRVSWMEATTSPAIPTMNVPQSALELRTQLLDLTAGIVKYGLDRQPTPSEMVRAQLYTNTTRDVIATELRQTGNGQASGWAAVYGDNVVLLTLVETKGAAFIIDGQQGQVYGPYQAGTMLLPAIVDALWTGGRINLGDPVALFAAN